MALDGDPQVNIDVFWIAPDDQWITRGYADCAFLESLLRNEGWQVPGQFTFTNHDIRKDIPHHDGAVVCISGMGLAPHADWIVSEINKMAWSLVIITGNECWDFPWQRLPETDTRRVWVMNPTPEHADLSYRLPGGWFTGTREGLADLRDASFTRPEDWFYGAQIINDRRRECLRAVQSLPNGSVITTESFMAGVPYPEWLAKMASAKVIPCPSGPMTLDANRPLVALEAGCVPVLDLRKPKDPQFDYWALVFGADYPMPTVFEWNELQQKMDWAIKDWPHQSNRMSAWWQNWKRKTAYSLHRHIAAVSGQALPHKGNERITVIVTSSPIPSHPDTSILDQTIASIREQLPNSEIIIALDGVRPEQNEMRHNYDLYVRSVVWKCNWEWENVLPMVADEWGHQANTTRKALTLVETDNILFMEHDTPLVGDIPWLAIVDQIENGTANAIRLHQDVDINHEHQHLMLDPKPTVIDGLPLRRTAAWWQRPHVASADFYRKMIDSFFHPDSRTMIEDRIYGPMWVDCTSSKRGWNDWRVWIYQPEGDMRRSGHLDGRGEADKFAMVFFPKVTA